jgi:hypothetical protein
MPDLQNWNVGVQQQLPWGIVADVSYVGSASHHLSNGNVSYNQLTPGQLSLRSLLGAQINSAAAQAAGIQSPYPGFTGTVAQAIRPYPQYQTITMTSDIVGNNTYNALQVKAEKRFSQGIAFTVFYVNSKNLTDDDGHNGSANMGNGTQNYYNLRAEKAVAALDDPQHFGASFTYDLPIGKGKWLNINQPVVNRVVGGWHWSGIITFEKGAPLGITTESSIPTVIGAIRPNVINGISPFVNNSRGSFVPQDLYLNVNAFAAPAADTFGDAPRLSSNIRAFGARQFDTAVFKNIPITERLSLNLKGEFFNAFNTVNFGAPVTDINNPSFGTITSAGTPRIVQLSATVKW